MQFGFGKGTELREKKSSNPNPSPELVDESGGDHVGTGIDSRSPLLKKNELLESESNQREEKDDSRSPLLKKNELLESESNQREEKDAARMEEGYIDKATPLQTEGNLTRAQILHFFQAATNRMRDPEVMKGFKSSILLCFFSFCVVYVGLCSSCWY